MSLEHFLTEQSSFEAHTRKRRSDFIQKWFNKTRFGLSHPSLCSVFKFNLFVWVPIRSINQSINGWKVWHRRQHYFADRRLSKRRNSGKMGGSNVCLSVFLLAILFLQTVLNLPVDAQDLKRGSLSSEDAVASKAEGQGGQKGRDEVSDKEKLSEMTEAVTNRLARFLFSGPML